MIARIENVDQIKPIFIEYLDIISQFFEINDHEAWRNGALKNLQRYSVEDNRYIYILKERDVIIGFTFINKHLRFNADGLAVAEFYIQKDHERKGYGRKLAEYVFAQLSGDWEVGVALKNTSAIAFWRQILSSYTSGKFKEKKISSFNGYGFTFNNA